MPTAFLRLPFNFDPSGLAADYARCVSREWRRHFNTRDFEGDWDALALRSATGGELDIVPQPSPSYTDTALLASCFSFTDVLERLQCEKESVRLLRLAPGSEIKEHRDHGAGYDGGSFRIHVPVHTNPRVTFRVGGHDVPMKEGETWYANVSLPHSVRNEGETDRIHLVIDAIRNEWTDAVFKEAGYDFEAEARAKVRPLAVRIEMLRSLETMAGEGARKLAEGLRLEIEAEQRTTRPSNG